MPAPKKSIRPKARPKARPKDMSPEAEKGDADLMKLRDMEKKAYGGKMKKMAMGGSTCRGMGAATRGGNYKMG